MQSVMSRTWSPGYNCSPHSRKSIHLLWANFFLLFLLYVYLCQRTLYKHTVHFAFLLLLLYILLYKSHVFCMFFLTTIQWSLLHIDDTSLKRPLTTDGGQSKQHAGDQPATMVGPTMPYRRLLLTRITPYYKQEVAYSTIQLV